MLNGGWQKWQREGRPVETGPGATAPGGQLHRARGAQPDGRQGRGEAAIGDGAICTINALLPQQHAGGGGNSYGRPGRIAGSVNLPAAHLLDPETNTFLPADELRRRFDAVGAMDRPVITYCGGGIAASADALALIMLGHKDVKLYDASLSEWAKDPTACRWRQADQRDGRLDRPMPGTQCRVMTCGDHYASAPQRTQHRLRPGWS